ncbi:MFS transporter [Paenibacillus wulumuqiensis]|uniref:MFS transporter n=1 Tax=Paenibacillus wulumuqiensis TaxID=1567107 RepID=UPI000A60643B|nr:MFS transporter [Paenibacillus wulumuqiensis]
MNSQISICEYTTESNAQTDRPISFPWSGLLALAMTGFICILTETLPAGLLRQIGEGLHISEALAGQLVTLYALGSLAAAIPLTTLTRSWRKKPLLLACIVGFLIFNSITALSVHYIFILAARFFAGMAAGVVWGMTAGYARRMVPESMRGRAMAVAMCGTPLALALGVPAGTLLGHLIGWRLVFGVMSLLTVGLIVWVGYKLPDLSGQQDSQPLKLRSVLTLAGVGPVLIVVLVWVLAHNMLYTYIAPYLQASGWGERTGLVLLLFGLASVAGIGLTGAWIDRWLRQLVLLSTAGFAAAACVLGLASHLPLLLYTGIVLWGLTFGGAATLLQTALADSAGEHGDVAQSMLVTMWNLAISGGGLVGGIVLETLGVSFIPWLVSLLMLIAWGITGLSRRHGFTSARNKNTA